MRSRDFVDSKLTRAHVKTCCFHKVLQRRGKCPECVCNARWGGSFDTVAVGLGYAMAHDWHFSRALKGPLCQVPSYRGAGHLLHVPCPMSIIQERIMSFNCSVFRSRVLEDVRRPFARVGSNPAVQLLILVPGNTGQLPLKRRIFP